MKKIQLGRNLMAVMLSIFLAAPTWADLEEMFAGKKVLDGVNVVGRGGLLFSDAARVPELHKGSVSSHLLYGSTNSYDDLTMPFGARYSPMDRLEVSASVPFIYRTYPNSTTGELDSTGLGVFQFGGKYKLDLPYKDLPDFAVGANIGLGPLSEDVNGFGVDWNLKGIATYQVPDQGIVLNGALGLIHTARRERTIVDGANTYPLFTDSETAVGLNLGVALAFTNNLTGIAEIAANDLAPNSGICAFGVRGGQKIQYQAFIGPGIGSSAPDFRLGGGVMFPF